MEKAFFFSPFLAVLHDNRWEVLTRKRPYAGYMTGDISLTSAATIQLIPLWASCGNRPQLPSDGGAHSNGSTRQSSHQLNCVPLCGG